ncbi:MAG: hypothetical protein KAI47_12925 [Deltaproteobacteria bacterium]|nr:hypothetical protein [Deltaproteobacteria bacterium]
MDLRRGDYAFKTDKSIFREKIFALAIASVLLLIFGAINAYAGLSAAEREGEVLEKALRVATRKLLGRPTSDPESVSRTLRRGIRQKGNGIPRLTAVDVLRMVSEYVPGKDAVKLDISRIDIKATKTYLRGTADSLSSVGEVVKGLKAVKCFKDVTSGKISGVADGKKEFSVTINTTCF